MLQVLGSPAVTAARKVMPNGKVLATDISPQMLATAKTRAKSFGLDGIMEFRESDGRKIGLARFKSPTFDAFFRRRFV